jgi:acyl carrier protein
MLAEDSAATRQLERAGVHQIPITDAMNALFRVMDLDTSVVSVMDVEWSAWMSVFPVIKTIPRFALLASEAATSNAGADYRATLLALPANERLGLLTQAMIGLVAEALHMPPEKIDKHQPLSELGIDSLVGVELQSSIGAKLGMQISILQLMKGGNIEEMAAMLLQKMNAGVPVAEPAPAPTLASEPAADNPSDAEKLAA